MKFAGYAISKFTFAIDFLLRLAISRATHVILDFKVSRKKIVLGFFKHLVAISSKTP